MCKVDCIIVIVELHAEGECVVMSDCLSLHGVLVVTDVPSSSDPTFAVLLGLNF